MPNKEFKPIDVSRIVLEPEVQARKKEKKSSRERLATILVLIALAVGSLSLAIEIFSDGAVSEGFNELVSWVMDREAELFGDVDRATVEAYVMASLIDSSWNCSNGGNENAEQNCLDNWGQVYKALKSGLINLDEAAIYKKINLFSARNDESANPFAGSELQAEWESLMLFVQKQPEYQYPFFLENAVEGFSIESVMNNWQKNMEEENYLEALKAAWLIDEYTYNVFEQGQLDYKKVSFHPQQRVRLYAITELMIKSKNPVAYEALEMSYDFESALLGTSCEVIYERKEDENGHVLFCSSLAVDDLNIPEISELADAIFVPEAFPRLGLDQLNLKGPQHEETSNE